MSDHLAVPGDMASNRIVGAAENNLRDVTVALPGGLTAVVGVSGSPRRQRAGRGARSLLLACCDHLIELGPGGGPDGGHVIAAGTPERVGAGDTPTAPYLRTVPA